MSNLAEITKILFELDLKGKDNGRHLDTPGLNLPIKVFSPIRRKM